MAYIGIEPLVQGAWEINHTFCMRPVEYAIKLSYS